MSIKIMHIFADDGQTTNNFIQLGARRWQKAAKSQLDHGSLDWSLSLDVDAATHAIMIDPENVLVSLAFS